MNYQLNAINATALISSNSLVELTKGINESVGKLPVDKYMDSVAGVGHRIKHGHDLTYLPEIYQKFGVDGVWGYFGHNFKDLMSPHGIPLPFTEEIRELLGFSYSDSINWLSINIGKLFSGSISIAHSAYLMHTLAQASATGVFSTDLLINAAIGSIIKIGGSLIVPNPITFIAGLFDLGALAFTLSPFYLNTGTIPLIMESSPTELLFSGTIKGLLLSLAVGIPIQTLKSYSEYKNGKDFQEVKIAFLKSILRLTLFGSIAGLTSSAIFLISYNMFISSLSGLSVYFGMKYISNKFSNSSEKNCASSPNIKNDEYLKKCKFIEKLNLIPNLS